LYQPSGFASALSLALAHSLWQLTLLSVLAAFSLSILKKSNAMLRHAAGMVWLLAMLAAPLATFRSCFTAPDAAGPSILGTLLPSTAFGAATTISAPWSDAALLSLSQLWMIGAALMLIWQLGGGWRMLRQIERQSWLGLPPAWQQRADALRAALGISRVVMVRLAGHAASPFTAHLLRPVIWLPLALLTHLPADQIEILLAHELAHIRRLDWLWNGIQCVIESLLFFHPGVWWLSRRIRQEREHACDDLAVAVCGDAIVLAEALTALQRQRLTSPRLVLAAHGGSLMKRIAYLLSAPSSPQTWRAPAFVLLMLCSGTLLATQPASAQLLADLAFDMVPAPPPPPPPPPTPPAAPALAAFPALPPPPAPPVPPVVDESAEFKKIFATLQTDSRLVTVLGQPFKVAQHRVDGNIDLRGRSGHASFAATLSGPRGQATMRYAGTLQDGVWITARLDVSPVTQ
jgi:beta-lactamase regulating signal transducer with metallopeptidase domain